MAESQAGQSERVAPRTLGSWSVRLLWEPRDLWLGAYRDTTKRRLYICVLPCLPLVIERSAP